MDRHGELWTIVGIRGSFLGLVRANPISDGFLMGNRGNLRGFMGSGGKLRATDESRFKREIAIQEKGAN